MNKSFDGSDSNVDPYDESFESMSLDNDIDKNMAEEGLGEDEEGLGDGEGGEDTNVEGMDLSHFMEQLKPPGHAEDDDEFESENEPEEDPSMRPLEGVSPEANNEFQKELGNRLGFEGEELEPGERSFDENDMGTGPRLQQDEWADTPSMLQRMDTIEAGEFYDPKGPLADKSRLQAENAAKVNDLLSRLKHGKQTLEKNLIDDQHMASTVMNSTTPAAQKAAAQAALTAASAMKSKAKALPPIPPASPGPIDCSPPGKAVKFGLGAPALSLQAFQDAAGTKKGQGAAEKHPNLQRNDSISQLLISNLDPNAAAAVKQMKIDMKKKENRLSRLMEHNTLLNSSNEQLKNEVTSLKHTLHEVTMASESLENRITSLKKKKVKKVKAKVCADPEGSVGGEDRSRDGCQPQDSSSVRMQVVVKDNVRLRDREEALLEAIQDLSSQNQELIAQLQESMEREMSLQKSRHVGNIPPLAAALTSHKGHDAHPAAPSKKPKKVVHDPSPLGPAADAYSKPPGQGKYSNGVPGKYRF